MKKILFISYYELKDYLLHLGILLSEKYKWEINNYPLFMYAYDQYSKINDYVSHLLDFITIDRPDIIFWWFIDIPVNVFAKVKQQFPNIYYVMYNPDDPINMNKSLLEKAKKFNMILTPCKHSVKIYRNHCNNDNIYFLPMGYEESIFKPYTELNKLDIETYSCDISFICDNLYKGFTDQYVPRKKLIDDIVEACKTRGWIFHLYGSYRLATNYPEHYKGDIQYINLPKLFQLSKINICTHITYKKKLIINQHIMPILASGGLLLIDGVRDIEKIILNEGKPGAIVMNKENYISQIDNILKMYIENDSQIIEIKKNAVTIAAPYSWDNFIKNIYILINKYFYDPNSYKNNHHLSETDATFGSWLSKLDSGIIEFPYKIQVPQTFNEKDYSINNELIDKSKEYSYTHWVLNGKNRDYMKHKSPSNLFETEMNTFTPIVFDLFRGFNMINIYNNIDQGLDIISEITTKYPYIDINSALNNYLDLVTIN